MKTRHYILIVCLIALSGGLIWYFGFHKKSAFKKRLIDLAQKEHDRWKGLKELSSTVSSILLGYWESAGKYFTQSQMQSSSFQSDWPWSSAFISHLFKKSGAGSMFPYSSAHSHYFQQAKADRNNAKAPLRGFRLSEYKPKEGDIIVFSRASNKGYDSTGHFPSHGELVTKVAKGFLKTISGNVGNTVSEAKRTLNQNGYLTTDEKPFFMVIQNNIT